MTGFTARYMLNIINPINEGEGAIKFSIGERPAGGVVHAKNFRFLNFLVFW